MTKWKSTKKVEANVSTFFIFKTFGSSIDFSSFSEHTPWLATKSSTLKHESQEVIHMYALLKTEELISLSGAMPRFYDIRLLLPNIAADHQIEEIVLFSNMPSKEVPGIETINWKQADIDFVLFQVLNHLFEMKFTLVHHTSFPQEVNNTVQKISHNCSLNTPRKFDIEEIRKYFTPKGDAT